MEELLFRLEVQIKQLIDRHDQLKSSNQELHQGKEILLTRQQKAVSQIEGLVSKLKAIEKIT
jgi:hypothetical protein